MRIGDAIKWLGNGYISTIKDAIGESTNKLLEDKVSRVSASKFCSSTCRPVSASKKHYFSPLRFLYLAGLFYQARGQGSMNFPSKFELSFVDGSNGFQLHGGPVKEVGHYLANAGDVNGDGRDDIVIGNFPVGQGNVNPGDVFVVFGKIHTENMGIVNLSSLNGTDGFVIKGEGNNDRIGTVGTAGDINKDGYHDLIIGAFKADIAGELSVGKTYIIYGGKDVGNSGEFLLSGIDGVNGFVFHGELQGDYSGSSVSSAGDVNKDGFDDFLIAARGSKPAKVYVIFGGSSLGTSTTRNLQGLSPPKGFVIDVTRQIVTHGLYVSPAGDLNNDGTDDILIGAPSISRCFVIFGGSNIGASGLVEAKNVDGSNGFRIDGTSSDAIGRAVSYVRDFNGDGINDIVLGAPFGRSNGKVQVGGAHVIFGGNDVGKSGTINVANLNGTIGVTFFGENQLDNAGTSVSSAGDLNKDNITDILIGAARVNNYAGRTYIMFGRDDFKTKGNIELANLKGSLGFPVDGNEGDNSGYSVCPYGDLNGGRKDAIAIAAYTATANGTPRAGKVYVIYDFDVTGRTFPTTTVAATSTFSTKKVSLAMPSSTTGSTITTTMNPTGPKGTIFSTNKVSLAMSSSTLGSTMTATMKPTGPKGTTLYSSTMINATLYQIQSTAIGNSSSSSSVSRMPTLIFSSKNMSATGSLIRTKEMIQPNSNTENSPILYIGLGAAGGALACTLIAGGVFFVIKKSKKKQEEKTTEMSSEYVSISSLQPEMQSARVENIYDHISIKRLEGHYQNPPAEPQQHTTDHYDQVSLPQLNRDMDQYQDAKMAKRHENYDDLPTV